MSCPKAPRYHASGQSKHPRRFGAGIIEELVMKSSKQSRPSQNTIAPLPDTLLQDQEIGDENFLEGEVRRVDYQGEQGNSQSTTPDQVAAPAPAGKKQRAKKQRDRVESEPDIRSDNGL